MRVTIFRNQLKELKLLDKLSPLSRRLGAQQSNKVQSGPPSSGISGRFPKASTKEFKNLGASSSQTNISVFFKLHNTSLVPLKCHPSSQSNVVIIHGVDGGCKHLRPLASRIHANVFGFQFTGKDGWSSIPELAAAYINEMKEKKLEGPYTIMGYSGGAAIALELAQQLDKATVQNLVFLDGGPTYGKGNINRTTALHVLNSLNALRNLSVDEVKSFESALTGDIGQDILQVFKILKQATGYELSPEARHAYGFLTKQLVQHVPSQPYDGDVILIQAAISMASSQDYNVSKFCMGQVLRHTVAGNHFSFLSEENVDETARLLNPLLT